VPIQVTTSPTSLLHAEVDGQRLSDLDFNLFFMLLIDAGGDTTRNLVAAGILALLENPSELQRLKSDPSLMPTAIEEMLRYTSPVTAFLRTATEDTELRGILVKAGDRWRCSTRRPTATRAASPTLTVSMLAGAESSSRFRRRRNTFLPRRQSGSGGGLGIIPEVLSRHERP